MPLNGSELIENPIETLTSPFTDLLGMAFWLIPICFIGVALFIKTKSPEIVSCYMIAVGVLLSGAGIFTDYPEMSYVFAVFTALGLVGLFMSVLTRRSY